MGIDIGLPELPETNFNELAKVISNDNDMKGFWDGDVNLYEKLMLVVTEISEAVEALRIKNIGKDKSVLSEFECYLYDYPDIYKDFDKDVFEKIIKDCFEDELADTFIRLLHIIGKMGIDIDKHIKYKVLYNRTRDFKHGKEA